MSTIISKYIIGVNVSVKLIMVIGLSGVQFGL